MTIEVRPQRESDRERVVALHAQAFRVPEYRLARQRNLSLDEGWVITDGGVVVGGLRAERLGQWFDGQSLGMSMVTAVKIAPETRGRGHGRRLMVDLLAALRERGIPLSTLYPSSPGLYRRAGYEIAGTSTRYRAPITDLLRTAAGEITEWTGETTPEIFECYREFARLHNGLVDRAPGWWSERILDPYLDRPTYRYAVRRAGRVTGYVVFGQEPDPAAHFPYMSAIHCLDLVWLDRPAATALLSFLGGQGPLISAASWVGPPNEPLGLVLDGSPLRASESFPWMLRLVDVQAALAQRRYPDGAPVDVAFAVKDDALPANSGAYRLRIQDGAADVTRLSKASATIDVRGLAACYSGFLPASGLARLGLSEGGDAALFRGLDRAFHGPAPWMVEMV